MNPRNYKKNSLEVRVGEHIVRLVKRLKFMETYKNQKPHFSQSCAKLAQRIGDLMSGKDDTPQMSEAQSAAYWSAIRSNQTEPLEPSYVPEEDKSLPSARVVKSSPRTMQTQVVSVWKTLIGKVDIKTEVTAPNSDK